MEHLFNPKMEEIFMAMRKKRRAKKAGKAAKPGKRTSRRGRKPGRRKKARGKKKRAVKKKPGKKAKKAARKPKKAAKEEEGEVVGITMPVKPRHIEKPKPSIIPTTFKGPTGSNHVKDFLTSKKVNFETIKHSPAFTAQQIAASAHVSGRNVAKTVIIKIDGKMAMVVEPAHLKVDLDALKRQLNAQRVELASEAEFRSHFPDCELGAMPPFGNLYGMDVFVSDNLSHDEFITFNAGTHSELLKMSYRDFYNLTRPKVVYA
jgi:Ala-tRNA(Pro) deacylase